jgi:hypothetical protein
MARKPTDPVKLQLRLTERLRRLLTQAAKDKQRSLNAEILHRLDQSFLLQNTLALMEEQMNNAVKAFAREAHDAVEATAGAAAKKAVEQIAQQLKQRSNDNDKAS